jgi:hypothetical protein
VKSTAFVIVPVAVQSLETGAKKKKKEKGEKKANLVQ